MRRKSNPRISGSAAPSSAATFFHTVRSNNLRGDCVAARCNHLGIPAVGHSLNGRFFLREPSSLRSSYHKVELWNYNF
jgi:hypothetical protein